MRFAVQVNLSQPLVSNVHIANKIHHVEYEAFPLICFCCGRFRHLKNTCPTIFMKKEEGIEIEVDNHVKKSRNLVQEKMEQEEFGDWIIVERW